MTDVHENDDHAQRPSLDRAFAHALRLVVVAWLIAFVSATVAVAILAREILVPSTLIAFASGAVAVASLLPGLFLGGGGPSGKANHATDFPRVAMFGILHRLAGTVALFLLCRYHMAASVEMIAGLTIGWYLFLTSVEVVALGRELPKSDPARIDAALTLAADT